MPPRHRFLEPIHNVKEGQQPHASAAVAAKIWSSYLEKLVEASALLRSSSFGGQPSPAIAGLASRSRESGEGWWSQSGSNRRPQACKASALPTELWPLLRSPCGELRRASPLVLCARLACQTKLRKERSLVGREGVEPSTSRLSGVRSNHLSYRPLCPCWPCGRRRREPAQAYASAWEAISRMKGHEDGGIVPWTGGRVREQLCPP